MLEVPTAPFARYAFFSRLPRADVYVVHRELLSGYEIRTLRRLCGRIVYDYADAVWTMPDRELSSVLARRRAARRASRFEMICSEADQCIAENMTQAQMAAPYQDQVRIVPTALDPDIYTPGESRGHSGAVRVGWLATEGDLEGLAAIVDRLADHAGPMQFSIVSDVPYDGPGRDFVFWSSPDHAREVSRLQAMDIGLAVYPDDGYSRAGSGLDVLRYMACGVAVVASDRGGVREIVDHGIDGFLCREAEDWPRYVLRLAGDEDLRRRMAEAARRKVVAKFGLAETSDQLWSAIGAA
jgi:glycosyltransferase involved in cell wall biosynthesis